MQLPALRLNPCSLAPIKRPTLRFGQFTPRLPLNGHTRDDKSDIIPDQKLKPATRFAGLNQRYRTAETFI